MRAAQAEFRRRPRAAPRHQQVLARSDELFSLWLAENGWLRFRPAGCVDCPALSDPRTQVHNETIGPTGSPSTGCRIRAAGRRSLLPPPAPPRQHAHLERPLLPLVGRPSHRRRRAPVRARVPSRIRAGRGTPSSSSEGSAAAAPGEWVDRDGRRAHRADGRRRRFTPDEVGSSDGASRCSDTFSKRLRMASLRRGTRQIRSGGEAVPKNAAALLHRG
jgi:hypothetical protein